MVSEWFTAEAQYAEVTQEKLHLQSQLPNCYPTMATIKSFDGGEFDAYGHTRKWLWSRHRRAQEIFGVNQYIRSVADWYATHGFVVICPDLSGGRNLVSN